MQTTILILICLLILLMFVVYDKVCNYKESIKSELLQNGYDTSRESENFIHGIQHGWIQVNISLFKMYSELEILDFDSLQSKLRQTLEFLSNNSEEMKEWSTKFNEYLKDQKNEY